MTINDDIETRKFDAEVGKVLNLMINSLYTNKDIFLRELISNASDACDKLRYEATTKPDLLKNSELAITIALNSEKNQLTVRDNGIGMNKQELIENLGTIARSGTQKFIEQMTGDKNKDVQLIGQFGVGFYSSFMVADKVIVKSRKAGEDQTWMWSSEGIGEFTIQQSEENIDYGTEITLELKSGEEIYVDKFRIQHIVNTYSDHISVPIKLIEKDKEETINSSSALWAKSKSDITKEEYNEFYKKVAVAGDEPWMTLHNKNEGTIEYTNLLFIPSTRTFDLFHPDRKRRVKLYIKKVFINDEVIDVIPSYLRFLRGIVDSEDLPLNISRESLQHSNVLQKIKKSIVKKVLSELAKKVTNDRDAYINFWSNFGPALKEGLCEPIDEKDEIMDICLFKSLNHNKFITLDEYVKDMPSEQDNIYYISGEDEDKLRTHPQLEGFKEKGFDVLLFTDSVDDFWVNVNHQYKNKTLKSVTRADINLEKNESKAKEKDGKKTDDAQLTEYFKKVLGSLVQDVKISKKLTGSPACLAVAEGAMDIRMERFLRDQKQLKTSTAKILEINSEHKIVQSIAEKLAAKQQNDATDDLVKILFDQACVIEGEPVDNSAGFAQRINSVLEQVL